MQLTVSLDSRALVRSPKFLERVTSLDFKRGDSARIEVGFALDGEYVELAAGATGKFGLKKVGDYQGSFLVQDTTWTKEGTGSGARYVFEPNFNTLELNELFLGASVAEIVDDETERKALSGLANGDIVFQADTEKYFVVVDSTQTATDAGWELAEQAASVTLMGEIEWRESGAVSSSVTFDARVANDVIKGNDGLPVSAGPGFYTVPEVDALLDAKIDVTEKGAADGVATLDGTSTVPLEQLRNHTFIRYNNTVSSLADLKAIATTSLPLGSSVVVTYSGTTRLYFLRSGTDAEVNPILIRPDDFHATTNSKVWERYIIDGRFLQPASVTEAGAVTASTQTLSGEKTFASNITFNGTNNVAPNQTDLASAGTLVTRQLAYITDLFDAPFMSRSSADRLATANAFAGESLTSGFDHAISLTAGSAVANNNGRIVFRHFLNVNGAGSNTRLDLPWWLAFDLSINTMPPDHSCALHVLIGASATDVPLASRGLGIRIRNPNQVQLRVHNGTDLFTTETTLPSVTELRWSRFVLRWGGTNHTLQVFGQSYNPSVGGFSRPTLLGSLVQNPGAVTSAGPHLAFCLHASASVPSGGNPTVHIGNVRWLHV